MEVLSKYYRKLDEVDRGLEQEAYRILANVQDQITQLNKDQLQKGQNKKGQKLSPKYSRVRYARAKAKVNPLPGFGTPDLKLTGRFYSDFFITAKNKEFTVFSSDEKADVLKSKYGEDIFGLTVENNRIVNYEILLPELLQWILQKLEI